MWNGRFSPFLKIIAIFSTSLVFTFLKMKSFPLNKSYGLLKPINNHLILAFSGYLNSFRQGRFTLVFGVLITPFKVFTIVLSLSSTGNSNFSKLDF